MGTRCRTNLKWCHSSFSSFSNIRCSSNSSCSARWCQRPWALLASHQASRKARFQSNLTWHLNLKKWTNHQPFPLQKSLNCRWILQWIRFIFRLAWVRRTRKQSSRFRRSKNSLLSLYKGLWLIRSSLRITFKYCTTRNPNCLSSRARLYSKSASSRVRITGHSSPSAINQI